jgi:hypothetical protein
MEIRSFLDVGSGAVCIETVRFSWSINLSGGMHALMTSRAKGGIFMMNLRKSYLKLFEF